MSSPLFTGPTSLRDPTERVAFWLTLLFAFPAAAAIGFVIHAQVGISSVALFVVTAMLYVTLARGRLLGSSVRIHEAQYPRVFAIVKRACAALEIPVPFVFVREDNFIPAAMLGLGEPYSLVLSSHWIETFKDDELAFIVGRQLGHVAAGHTRFLSLLSVNGNENPIVALIFGAWLRRCELTCDKVGLLVCGSIDAAVRAISVASFHHFGRQVDLEQFAEQGRDVHDDSILRWGEWLGAEPYATKRIKWMYAFLQSHAFDVASQWFLRDGAHEPPSLLEARTGLVKPEDCAGWWRRFAAVAIDLIVVLNLVSAFSAAVPRSSPSSATPRASVAPNEVNISGAAGNITIRGKHGTQTPSPAPQPTASPAKDSLNVGGVTLDEDGIHFSNGTWKNPLAPLIDRFSPSSLWVVLYFALLVAVAGQTFGMMIAGVRVVTTDFRKPGVGRTIWRYAIVFALWWLIAALSPFLRRVMLHDMLSGTRLVTAEGAAARTLANPASAQ